MDKKRIICSLLLLFAAVIWGTSFVFQRAGMDYIEPITFTAARMTLAALAVGLVSLFPKKPTFETAEEGKTHSRNTIIGGVCCGAFIALASILQQIGIMYTTAGKAGFLSAMYILGVPIFGFLLFKKRPSWFVWVAVALGVGGMYLLCVTEQFQFAFGDVLLCLCAVLYGGHILCVGHFVQKGNPIRISALQFLTTAVISWIVAFIVESPGLDKIVSAIVPILYSGLVSGGVGFTIQMFAQKHTDPTVASLLMSLESVFAVIAGALFLHERMSPRELIGCGVLFVAIIIAQLPAPKKRRKEPADAQ